MNYRYPGPQSFGEKDESLFFGRRKETKALLDLILVQSLVVLFAKSGMGKTSLLQAGIIPKLRFTEYDPIVIRLNDPKVSLENQVLRRLTPNVSPNSTLWSEIVHYNQISNGTPLLIFDQFEEIFTLYSEGQREKFVSQLADVINGTLPESIRKQIGNKITKEHVVPSEIAILEQLPKVKIVLSIRSDLLHFLHLLSPEIPSILRNRFELLGLQPDQAREAIINPAKQTQASGDFASQPFALTSKALDQIINHLSQRKHSDYFESSQRVQIESFQLQLLCEYIERKVISEYPKVATSLILLTSHFFGGNEGIEEVLSRFYSNTLENITDLSQLSKAQRLLEDHLIKSERRVSVDRITIMQTHGVSQNTLDLLVNKRLLRRDIRETGEYFEISHDTLLSPILKSKGEWEAKQTAKRVRRLVGLIFAMLIVLAGAVAFGIWAFRQKALAEEQTRVAKEQTAKAEEEKLKAEAAKIKSDSLFNQLSKTQKEKGVAVESARQNEAAYLKSEADRNKVEYEIIFKEAEILFNAEGYKDAKQKYEIALKIAPSDQKKRIQSRINECIKRANEKEQKFNN